MRSGHGLGWNIGNVTRVIDTRGAIVTLITRNRRERTEEKKGALKISTGLCVSFRSNFNVIRIYFPTVKKYIPKKKKKKERGKPIE